MRQVLQETVSDRFSDDEFITGILNDETAIDLYKRRIWLALDCPNIDNIGGRIVEDIGL